MSTRSCQYFRNLKRVTGSENLWKVKDPSAVRLDLLIQQEQFLNLPGPSSASYCTLRMRTRQL